MKIILGNLKHKTIGRHSPFMPINIAYIASYTLSKISDLNISLCDDIDIILNNIIKFSPDVLGLSNYCWNSELSSLVFKYAKKNNPDILTIAGGPDFPEDHDECRKYLLNKKEIDFYIYREGEIAFCNLIKKFLINNKIDKLKNQKIDGTMSIYFDKLIIGKEISRIRDLDIIPSPYLTHLLDPWFDGYNAPSLETTRGCPFLCQYCHTGNECYNKIGKFSIKRIKDELVYISKKMNFCSRIPLSICDTNFGIYKRDEEIVKHIQQMQKKYKWPIEFDITTGKTKYDKILDMIKQLGGMMRFDCAVQSMHLPTLNIIKRRNLSFKKIKELQKKAKNDNIIPIVEFIIPLPKETKNTFMNGISKVMNSGIRYFIPYTFMMLNGTGLSSKKNRDKYRMKTKFRVIPRMFGEYEGEKCFEIEEVCISTNTFSFEDYIECRGFILIASLLGSDQVDIIFYILQELNISIFDFVYSVWEYIKNKKDDICNVYNEYLQETKNELWDNKKDIYNFFSQKKNYNKLLKGEKGDNLIRKYKSIILLKYYKKILDLFYEIIQEKIKDKINKEINVFLNDSKQWMLSVRDVNDLLEENFSNQIKEIFLSYDINKWYLNKNVSFLNYKKPVFYKIYFKNLKKLKKEFYQREKLFGKDYLYSIGKLLIDGNISFLWKNCEIIKSEKK